MASFTFQSIIDAARVYCDDDHDDEKGWIAEAAWLRMAIVEYKLLWKRWVRGGKIPPKITTTSFSANPQSITNAYAIIGVAQDMGDYPRILENVQPFVWRGSDGLTGDATVFSVEAAATTSGAGHSVSITLDPAPTDVTDYVVKYIPEPDLSAATANTSVELPMGGDERLILGLARRAGIKDHTTSALVERLIGEQDAELAFTSAARMGGLTVKILPKRPSLRARASTPYRNAWPTRDAWLYF